MIGRASRIAALGNFIAYMKRHGAWITTCEEAARYVLHRQKPIRRILKKEVQPYDDLA